jgi:hypothetical protein
MAEHNLVGDAVEVRDGGVHAECSCGWKSGGRFSGLVASALFLEHLESIRNGTPTQFHDDLYEVAKRVSHDHGYDWTDPRTGEKHPAPEDKK